MHAKAIEEAKAEAKQVTDEAATTPRASPSSCVRRPTSKLERIKAQGAQQVQLLRHQLIRQLRQSLGDESVHRASEMVSEHVSDAVGAVSHRRPLPRRARRDGTVANRLSRTRARRRLRAASRQSLAALVETLRRVAADLDADGLTTLADDLASVAKLLVVESRS